MDQSVLDVPPNEEFEPEFPLPRFMLRRSDGLFVDLEQFNASQEFRLIFERLLAAGACPREIDYPLLVALAFEFERGAAREDLNRRLRRGGSPLLRWASGLRRLAPERHGLYRSPTVSRGEAVYLFERVVLEREIEVPLQGEDGEDGEAAGRVEKRSVEVEARLDLDEFIVAMWLKGIRFGLEVKALREAIEGHFLGRLVIARALPPKPGEDASVKELAGGLRRDDTPRVLADGRADLSQFATHFPQVRKGLHLLRKVPPVAGVPGRDLSGEVLAAEPPADFDLHALAGEGTAVERIGEAEVLLAAMDGFLSIDAASNQMSISEKIINRQGVNIRTTGNLALTGDEYEEFGEIQEGRTVSGRSITTHADVFGNLVSSGGVIRVTKNLSGGSALNRNGRIEVEGMTINAVLRSPRGELEVRQAEGSLLCGHRVVVAEQALGCDIQGDDVELAEAAGCAVLGTRIRIASASAGRAGESLITILLPELGDFERELSQITSRIRELDAADQRAHETRERAAADPDVARLRSLQERLRSGAIQLRADQKPAFEALARRAAPVLKLLGSLAAEIEERAAARAELQNALTELGRRRAKAIREVSCSIEQVGPGVIIRTLRRASDAKPLGGLSASELRRLLHTTSAMATIIATPESGRFEWQLSAAHGEH